MPQGSLQFTIRTAESAFPVPSADVTLLAPDGQVLGRDRVTNENGSVSRKFSVDAPERSLSLSPGEALPYSVVDARIEADGFYTYLIRGIQIFAGEESVLPAEMIPRGQSEDVVLEYDIGPHALRTTPDPFIIGPGDGRVLERVFIPEKVTVHLGTPNSSAQNVTVPFVDYIKNVASSEIYPTWPENSLRANILCQISFVLNRIFTEWYPSRGYNFNITNSTAFDQYFVYGRNIYESISRIVDEIFNEYIRRPGRIDPYFAEYCNGSTVTCAGLSQWGTVTLAQNGRTPLEILQFYYGDVEIVENKDVRPVEESYPGSALRSGSSGRAVRTIQQQLNRIRVNYPSIPAITNVDGVFGPETEAAVRRFQTVFDLTPDGVVGKRTWYRISFIYVAVKKLAELNSEGERPQYDDQTYPGLLRFGDTGTGVQSLQYYLKTIAAYNPFLTDLSIDGFFGRGTEEAVKAFQSTYGLEADGVVGETTWNRIVSVYGDVTEEGQLILRPYPGRILRQGSTGDDVLYEQILLNTVRSVFPTIASLDEDGIFGPKMRSAVREFQSLFGLSADGLIGRDTWNGINRVYGSVKSGCFKNGAPVEGRILRIGSQGEDVAALQRQLNIIGRSLPSIPSLVSDGAFGTRTRDAVAAFQRIFGLADDGVVGTDTRTRLASAERASRAGCFPLPTRDRVSERVPSLPAMSSVQSQEPTLAISLHKGAAEGGLYPGSAGARVREMKLALTNLGYLVPIAMGDRNFYGPATARAVLAFQEDRGLVGTGVADQKTLSLLLEEGKIF